MPAILATGHSLYELLFPDDSRWSSTKTYSSLGGFLDGKPFEINVSGAEHLVLSPDGRSVVAVMPILSVPGSWVTLYPPPHASDPYKLGAASRPVQQYARISLQTGSIQQLTDAPSSISGGWWALVHDDPSWSSDGQAILLPGTYLTSKNDVPSKPCIAVVDLRMNTRTCVETLKGHTATGAEEGYEDINSVRFTNGDRKRVTITYENPDSSIGGATEYFLAPNGTWQVARRTKGGDGAGHQGLEVGLKQGLNQPPLLVASNEHTSRVIWDPNPQLREIELGEASVYTWKDKDGREWKGGLYRPVNYKPGIRYPLVIQTHGFRESEFNPSGIFPSGFAARELAGAGIAVLQIAETHELCPYATPKEVPGCLSGYESAVNQLVSDGLADRSKIGIIGFSRTGTYVMSALAFGRCRFKAALIEDTDLVDYFQYMSYVIAVQIRGLTAGRRGRCRRR